MVQSEALEVSMETLFTKIGKGEIPSVQLFSDELCYAILDIAPVNKGHALVISREPYPTLEEAPLEVLERMMKVVKRLSKRMREQLKAEATNIIVNNGPAAGQEVPHLHIHVIPRFEKDGKGFAAHKMQYDEGEMPLFGDKLRIKEL